MKFQLFRFRFSSHFRWMINDSIHTTETPKWYLSYALYIGLASFVYKRSVSLFVFVERIRFINFKTTPHANNPKGRIPFDKILIVVEAALFWFGRKEVRDILLTWTKAYFWKELHLPFRHSNKINSLLMGRTKNWKTWIKFSECKQFCPRVCEIPVNACEQNDALEKKPWPKMPEHN